MKENPSASNDPEAQEMGGVELVPSASESVPTPKKTLSFYASIVGLGMVSLITAWDATSLAIALPTITSHLGGTTLESFWANISFILGVAITQPIYVSLSDVLGRKIPLYASLILFAIGVIVFSVARNMPTLIAGRLIQGMGGGGLYVLQDIILADITSLKERPKYLGLLAVTMALGTVLGPIVGALFADHVDWRWIGWINLPFVGMGFLIFVFFLRLRSIPLSAMEKFRRVDLVGMSVFAAGATAMALPLSWAGALYPWASWKTTTPLVIGFVLLLVFGFYEKKVPAEPVLPFRIFNNITSIASLISGFMHGSIMYTVLLYIPLFFQAVYLQTPWEAAKSTLPLCVVTVAFSFIAPVTIEITRRYRLLLWVGWVVLVLSLGLWCMVDQKTSLAQAYVFQSLLGAGIGTSFTGGSVPIQASVSHVDDTGLAVGTLIVIRIFGALVGLSVGSTVFNSIFSKSIAALGTLPDAVMKLEDASQAIDFIPTLRTLDLSDEYMTRLVGAYREPFLAIWIVLTCFGGFGFLVCLSIKELTLEKEDVGRQGFETATL